PGAETRIIRAAKGHRNHAAGIRPAVQRGLVHRVQPAPQHLHPAPRAGLRRRTGMDGELLLLRAAHRVPDQQRRRAHRHAQHQHDEEHRHPALSLPCQGLLAQWRSFPAHAEASVAAAGTISAPLMFCRHTPNSRMPPASSAKVTCSTSPTFWPYGSQAPACCTKRASARRSTETSPWPTWKPTADTSIRGVGCPGVAQVTPASSTPAQGAAGIWYRPCAKGPSGPAIAAPAAGASATIRSPAHSIGPLSTLRKRQTTPRPSALTRRLSPVVPGSMRQPTACSSICAPSRADASWLSRTALSSELVEVSTIVRYSASIATTPSTDSSSPTKVPISVMPRWPFTGASPRPATHRRPAAPAPLAPG